MEADDYLDYINHSYRKPLFRGREFDWVCPYCGKGHLVAKDEDFHAKETEKSIQERNHPEWEPEWIHYTFTAALSCSSCEDKTMVIGEGKVDQCYCLLYTSPSPRD